VLIKIPNILDGIGRSNLLPRQTREHRLHLAETISHEGSRNTWKLGGDGLLTWIYDFFPHQQSGEYLFYSLKVNPFTFQPMEAGLPLSPLRAYAHEVPHYYLQNFGSAASHPDTNEYAAFAQDTIRVTDHLALSLGVRWDLQTFTTVGLLSNPLFPPSGKVPFKPYNFAPRAGLAYSFGTARPSSSAPDTASSSFAIPRSTTRSSKPKTALPMPVYSSTIQTITTTRFSPTIPIHS
jgi:outer membrane receptor protein involved in Fe transport